MTKPLPTRHDLEVRLAALSHIAAHTTDADEAELVRLEQDDLLEAWARMKRPSRRK